MNFDCFKLELLNHHNLSDSSKADVTSLGLFLLDFVCMKTNLFTKYTETINDISVIKLIPAEGLSRDLINKYTAVFSNVPMVCKPVDWEIEIDKQTTNYKITKFGGYFLNEREDQRKSFLHKSNKNLSETKFNNTNQINTINYLSNIELIINIKLLEHLCELLESNNTYIKDLIILDPHPYTQDIHKYRHASDTTEYRKILKHNSIYYNDKTVFSLALLYSGVYNRDKNDNTYKLSSIFLPYFMDWRGRLYHETGIFSPQSSTLAKSLFMFKKGETIKSESSLNALKVYVANCYGYDKLSYTDRLYWVNDNLDKIVKIDYSFIFKAEEPLLFLAACLELKGYCDNPETFISRLPIFLDATCNGLQHLSAMVKDTKLAKYVNIFISNKDEIPNDLYNEMVKLVNISIQSLIKNKPDLVKLSDLHITRKFIKKAIMTIPYGVTKNGVRDQLLDLFFEKLNSYTNVFIDPPMVYSIKFKKKIQQNIYKLTDNTFNKKSSELLLSSQELSELSKILYSVL